MKFQETMTVTTALSLALAAIFVSSALGLPAECGLPSDGSTLRIIHVNSPCSPFRPKTPQLSWEDGVLRTQAEDRARLQYLSSLVAGRSIVPVASGRAVTQNPTYVVKAMIGTPAQPLFMAVDTSNDVALLPCAGCVGCSPAFDPSKSSTFQSLACGAPQCSQVPRASCGGATCVFNSTYGSSAFSASLVQDNITLAADSVPSYTFGCIQTASGTSLPAQGLLGLGRGSLSLLSQTSDLYQSTFSYCLPSYKSPNFTGSLRLGPNSQPQRILFTQLLRNQRRSSLYYVNLVGIKVGRGTVNIPLSALAFDSATGAGTVFDSGTVFTSLAKPVYTAVRDEFRRRMGNATVSSLGGFDTCYTVPITIPTITFKFTGLNYTLPQDNFLIRSSVGTTSCLAMAAAPDNVNSVLNVIASFQQQNHRVFIDIPNSRLGVGREACS